MDRILTKENSCVPEYLFRRKTSTRWAEFSLRKTAVLRKHLFPFTSDGVIVLMKASFPRSLSPSLFTYSQEPVSQLENGFAQNHRATLVQNAG